VMARKPNAWLSGSGVAMVKPRDAGEGDDAARTRRLHGAGNRCVTVERHVRPVLVVVGGVRLYEAQQVALSEDDHVVQDLAPERADEALRVTVLPGRPGRGLELPDTEMAYAGVEHRAVDSVPITNQPDDSGIAPDRLDDLLRGPLRVGMGCDVDLPEALPREPCLRLAGDGHHRPRHPRDRRLDPAVRSAAHRGARAAGHQEVVAALERQRRHAETTPPHRPLSKASVP